MYDPKFISKLKKTRLLKQLCFGACFDRKTFEEKKLSAGTPHVVVVPVPALPHWWIKKNTFEVLGKNWFHSVAYTCSRLSSHLDFAAGFAVAGGGGFLPKNMSRKRPAPKNTFQSQTGATFSVARWYTC
jgi:hypothetical protein